MSKSYWELLKDPRWQRMRLEVMERDEFACLDCGATQMTLNVHHTYYEKGRKPWEYPVESLRTLCEECHASTSNKLGEVSRLVGSLPPYALDEAIGFLRGFAALHGDGYDPEQTVAGANYEQLMGIAQAFGIIGSRPTDLVFYEAAANGGAVKVDWLIGRGYDVLRRLRGEERWLEPMPADWKI